MKIIIDSGSTKSDWLIKKQDGEILETQTMGFNPLFHSSKFIEEKILGNTLLKANKENITSINYYGAGCSNPERNAIVMIALRAVFPNTKSIDVAEDMLAAVLATCKNEKGIVCILGTGSNSCYFDGDHTHSEVPSLGYILGDEGSGAAIGKGLLKDYLYGRMPAEISACMDKLGFQKNEILTKVYHEPHANVFLASLVKETAKFKNHPYISEIIEDSIAEFAKIHITCFKDYQNIPVHFVGSIAFHFKEILIKVSKVYNFKVGKIIKQPIKFLIS